MQGGGYPGESLVLRGVFEQGVDGVDEVLEGGAVAGFHLQLETAGRAQAGNDGRRGKEYLCFRVLEEFGADVVHDLFEGHIAFLAFFPRLEDDGEFGARLCRTDAGAASRHVLHVGDGGMLLDIFYGPVGHLTRAFERGAFRQCQFHFEVPLVFLGQEAAGNDPVEDEDEDDGDAEPGDDAAGVGECSLQEVDVFVVTACQPIVDFAEHVAFFARGGAQQQGAHGGAERQCHDQ